MARSAKLYQKKLLTSLSLKSIVFLTTAVLSVGIIFTSCAKKNEPTYDIPTEGISSEDFDTTHETEKSDTDSSSTEREDTSSKVTESNTSSKADDSTENSETEKKQETTQNNNSQNNNSNNNNSNNNNSNGNNSNNNNSSGNNSNNNNSNGNNSNNNNSNGNNSNNNNSNGNNSNNNNSNGNNSNNNTSNGNNSNTSKPSETTESFDTREPDEPPADFKSTLDYYNSIDYDALMAGIKKSDMSDIPYIYIEGDLSGITKENKKAVKVSYSSKEQNFECYGMMDIQGASSAGYSKKNYNIRFYSDEARTKKYKVNFNGWGKESKFCLKANYIDATMARNIVSARLWGQVVDTRRNVDTHLTNLVNRGAIDGFPIIVKINNEKPALYTLNIPRDKWMFDMGDSDTEAIMMASYETNSTKFGKLYNLNDSNSGWKIEYAAGETPNWAVNSLNNVIQITINSGTQFKTNIAKYVDIESAIDYLLFLYFTTGQDNCCKNTIWATFDGKTWITSVYDLDSTWGLYWNGGSLMSPSSVMPIKEKDGSYSSQTWSRIWEHIFQNFTEEIIARYSELRATVFTPENVEYEFTRFMAQIPDEAFDLEYDHYPYIPSRNITSLKQILNHHKNVLRYMDATFEGMSQYYLGTSLKVYYD